MTRDQFFASLAAGAKWDVGVSIARTNPLPLDANSVFESEEALSTYVTTNPLAYPGQVVSVLGETESAVYQITAVGETGTYNKLAANPSSGDIVTDLNELSNKVANLETLLEDMDTEVEGLKTIIGDDTAGIVKDVADIKTDLSAAQEGVSANTEAIESLTTSTETNTSDISGLKTQVSELSTKADTLATKEEVATAKTEAIDEAVLRILGENVDADFDTLKEVADWIASDTTNSAALIERVSAIEADYLKGADKTELNNSITALQTFIGELPEGAVSTTVVAYIQEAIDAGEFAKLSAVTALAERVAAAEGKITNLETAVEDATAEINTIKADVASANDDIAALNTYIGEGGALQDLLAGKVDKASSEYGGVTVDHRLLTPEEQEKLSKLILNADGSVETGSSVAAGDVVGLAEWLKVNGKTHLEDLSEANFTDEVVTKLNNVVREVAVNGTTVAPVDGKVDLPPATNAAFGVVKLGSEFKTAEGTGELQINSVNVDKLVQDDVLDLYGGSASGWEAQ